MSVGSILILPGDGIGPEVMAQVRRIIDVLELTELHMVGTGEQAEARENRRKRRTA